MTMLHHTGFEQGTLRVFDVAAGTTISSAVKRNGNYALLLNAGGAYAEKLITPGDEFYFRTGIRVDAFRCGITFYEGATPHCTIDLNPTLVEARRGDTSSGTLLGSGGSVAPTQWYLLEGRGKIHDTAGILQAKIDGNLIIDLQNIDTRNAGATGIADRYRITTYGVLTAYIDDLAICNPLGTRNNTWLGNGYGLWLPPDSPGDVAQLNRSGGAANWENVDEVPPNDDVDYVYHDTVDLYDLYNLAASGLPDGSVINAITAEAIAKLATVGNGNLRTGIRSAGLESWCPDQPLASDTWKVIRHLLEVDPLGANWTKALLDLLQVGVKVR